MSIVEQNLNNRGISIVLGKAYLRRGQPNWAKVAIDLVGDNSIFKTELLECGELCLKRGDLDDAFICFSMLGDKAKLLECCEHFIKRGLLNKAFEVFKATVLLKE